MISGTQLTEEKKTEFLKELRESGNVSGSCKVCAISRTAAYKHRKEDQAFAAAWDEAVEVATDALEAEARRRAFAGVEEPVHYQGVRVDTIRRYSDTLLIFLLKGLRPEKYRERSEVKQSGRVSLVIEG